MMVGEEPWGLEAIARAALEDRPEAAVVARVVEIQGFSSWLGDEVVVVDDGGKQIGTLLGGPGRTRLASAARDLIASRDATPVSVRVEIAGKDVVEAGLSCGGSADLLLQPMGGVPRELWRSLADRVPVALVTSLGVPPGSVVVTASGSWGGPQDDESVIGAVAEARELLRSGQSARRWIDDPTARLLVEAWVPSPRVVVVGTGDVAAALGAQAALLGWETTVVDSRDDATTGPSPLADALDWAGATAAVAVLSHDPHVDVPALRAALDRGVPYIGAMGSRRTQSRRLERLRDSGGSESALERIRRPIGLDLGGRSPAAIAMAICAEILAVSCGRDAQPLGQREGPINPPG